MQKFFEKRIKGWKMAGLLLCACCAAQMSTSVSASVSATAQTSGHASVGTGPAPISVAVPTSIVAAGNGHEAVGHSASKTVLVLGDSLSAEYGLARGTGWVPLLERRLQAKRIDAPIINASISGDTTSGGRSRLPPLLAREHPGVVVIELGGNDALRGLSLAATEANLLAMINAATASGARVVLLGMQIPPNYGGDYARRFAAMYPHLAKQTGATLVPFFLEGLQTRPDLFQADRIHPVAGAQSMLLDNVWPYLAPLLSSQHPSSASAHAVVPPANVGVDRSTADIDRARTSSVGMPMLAARAHVADDRAITTQTTR